MVTEQGGNKSESEVKKGLILENLGRLQSRISSLQEELRTSSHPKNLCWWDAKPCGCYTEIAGMQEAGIRCRDCGRVDNDRFDVVLEEISPGCLNEAKEEAEEKIEKAEGDQEQTLQEIHEEILNVMANADVEPVDPAD